MKQAPLLSRVQGVQFSSDIAGEFVLGKNSAFADWVFTEPRAKPCRLILRKAPGALLLQKRVADLVTIRTTCWSSG